MNRVIGIIVVSIIIMGIAAPLAEAQEGQGWVILPDNSLYFVGERANIQVYGPPNTFFYLNVNCLANNGTNVDMWGKSTGPTGNVTVILELYQEKYNTGTYSLNITYLDNTVSQKTVEVIRDEERLEAQADARRDQDIANNQDDIRQNKLDIAVLGDIVRGIAAPLSILAFCFALFSALMVIVFITIPRQRFYNEQHDNSTDASVRIGKKLEKDIITVNGASHPAIEPSQYSRMLASLRKIGYPDDYIDQIFINETGRFDHSVKPVPKGYVWGGFLIMRVRKDRAAEGYAAQVKQAEKAKRKEEQERKKAIKKLQKELKKGKISGAEYDKQIKDLEGDLEPEKPVKGKKPEPAPEAKKPEQVTDKTPEAAESPSPTPETEPPKKPARKRKKSSRKRKRPAAKKEAA